ncbi:MATH domain and coiled-coil domain-containing protein [Dirofilaria immitis]
MFWLQRYFPDYCTQQSVCLVNRRSLVRSQHEAVRMVHEGTLEREMYRLQNNPTLKITVSRVVIQQCIKSPAPRLPLPKEADSMISPSRSYNNSTDDMDNLQKPCCDIDSNSSDCNESGWYHLTDRRYYFPPACCQQTKTGH